MILKLINQIIEKLIGGYWIRLIPIATHWTALVAVGPHWSTLRMEGTQTGKSGCLKSVPTDMYLVEQARYDRGAQEHQHRRNGN